MAKYLFYAAAASTKNVFSLCELNTETEKLTHIRKVYYAHAAQLALSKNQKRLHVACEMGGAPGGVDTYDISNPYNPVLMSSIRPGTCGPCFIVMSADEKYVIGCGFSEGEIEVFPVLDDGGLGDRCFETRLTATGTAYHPGSFGQAVPRSHGAVVVRGTDYVLVTDYSGDSVVCFRLGINGTLTEVSSLQYPKGGAPRHLAAHPVCNDMVYMVTEYTAMVYPIHVDAESGKLTYYDGIHTLENEKASFCSAIKISPDGRFIYVPNRDNMNISVLSIHDNYRRLAFVGVLPRAGFVRDVEFDPSGKYLVSGDQSTNTINLYRRNLENGMCAKMPTSIEAEHPAYFVFLEHDEANIGFPNRS